MKRDSNWFILKCIPNAIATIKSYKYPLMVHMFINKFHLYIRFENILFYFRQLIGLKHACFVFSMFATRVDSITVYTDHAISCSKKYHKNSFHFQFQSWIYRHWIYISVARCWITVIPIQCFIQPTSCQLNCNFKRLFLFVIYSFHASSFSFKIDFQLICSHWLRDLFVTLTRSMEILDDQRQHSVNCTVSMFLFNLFHCMPGLFLVLFCFFNGFVAPIIVSH